MSTAEEPQVRRTLVISLVGLGLLAVVWLLVLGPMLLGEDEEDFTVPRPERTPDVGVVPDLDEPDGDGELVPESYDVFAARDPFQQLVPEGTGSGAGSALPPVLAPINGGTTGGTGGTSGDGTSGDGTTGDGTTGDGTSGDGTSGDGTSGDGTTGDGATGDGSQSQVGDVRVKLVDVYTDDADIERAVVTVDGRTYEPAEGETFAQRFRLLDISGECATFLYGDNRFVLCEGEEIRK